MMLIVVKNCLLYPPNNSQISMKSHIASALLYLYFMRRHSIAVGGIALTHSGRLHARTLHLLTCSFSSHGFFSPFFVTADRSDRIHHEHESARACTSSAVSLVFAGACIGTTFRIEYTLTFWPTRMKSIDNEFASGCLQSVCNIRSSASPQRHNNWEWCVVMLAQFIII